MGSGFKSAAAAIAFDSVVCGGGGGGGAGGACKIMYSEHDILSFFAKGFPLFSVVIFPLKIKYKP